MYTEVFIVFVSPKEVMYCTETAVTCFSGINFPLPIIKTIYLFPRLYIDLL